MLTPGGGYWIALSKVFVLVCLCSQTEIVPWFAFVNIFFQIIFCLPIDDEGSRLENNVTLKSSTNMLFLSCLFPLCYFVIVSSEPIRVFQTSDDISQFNQHSGAQIKNSSLFGQEKATICARFLNYQFTGYDHQNIFSFGIFGVHMGSTTLFVEGEQNGMFVFTGWVQYAPIWDLGVWNHICVLMDAEALTLKLIMNGEIVLIENKYERVHMKDKPT